MLGLCVTLKTLTKDLFESW